MQIFLGGVLAVGSKENLLVLVPLTWLLAGWLAWRRQLGLIGLLGTLCVTLVGLFIAGVVYLSVTTRGATSIVSRSNRDIASDC